MLYVEYEYWVGGEYFTSNTIGSRRPSSDASGGKAPSAELDALLKQYSAGNRIDVYVSPDKPERALLIRLGPAGLWLMLVGLLALAGAAVLRFRAV